MTRVELSLALQWPELVLVHGLRIHPTWNFTISPMVSKVVQLSRTFQQAAKSDSLERDLWEDGGLVNSTEVRGWNVCVKMDVCVREALLGDGGSFLYSIRPCLYYILELGV